MRDDKVVLSKENMITFKNGRIYLCGQLNFNNIVSIYRKGLEFLTSHIAQKDEFKEITIDFSNVKDSDSSSLALLIEWLRWGNKFKINIHFENLPVGLVQMIDLIGMKDIFKL